MTLDIPNCWARGYCYHIWCMLVAHFRTFSKAASVCITSCHLHRILGTNWNIAVFNVFDFIRFLFQSTGRGRIRFADGGVRFPRSGLFGSSAPRWDGRTPRHADTLPHRREWDFRVSHSSECFNTGQYTECALARALREKQRRNISLNYAALLEELVAQNCDWLQNMPVPAGARNLHANVYRLALGHTQSLIPWIQALFPRGKAAGSWCWRRPLSSTKVENGCSCTSYSQFWFHGMDRDNFYFLLYKIFLLMPH